MSTKNTSIELVGLTPAQTASLISLCGGVIGKSDLSGLAGQFIVEDGRQLSGPLCLLFEKIARELFEIRPTDLTLRVDQSLRELLEETNWSTRGLLKLSEFEVREGLYPPDSTISWDYFLIRVPNRRYPSRQVNILSDYGFRGCTVRELLSWLLTCKDAEGITHQALSDWLPIVANGDLHGARPGVPAMGMSMELGMICSGESRMQRTIHDFPHRPESYERGDMGAIYLCAREK